MVDELAEKSVDTLEKSVDAQEKPVYRECKWNLIELKKLICV